MRLYGQNPPAAFRTNPRYAATLHEVRFYVTTAIAMLSSGQFGAAREALETNRRLLHELRQASGIEVLADCVIETNAAMARFFAFDAVTPDLAKPEIAARRRKQSRSSLQPPRNAAMASLRPKCARTPSFGDCLMGSPPRWPTSQPRSTHAMSTCCTA